MTKKIRILIADDIDMQVRFKQLFSDRTELLIVGLAASAEDAVQKARTLKPDIVLYDLSLQDSDGFCVTETISTDVPEAGVILMGAKSGQEELRKAMLAGAKDYIVKPFPSEELFAALERVYSINQRRRGGSISAGAGKVLTIYSPRGGAGKTAIAVNLAIALAKNSDLNVAIVDCSLQFGDVAMIMNVMPKASIAEMTTDIEHINEKILARYMVSFQDNLQILPAPFKPEKAETVTALHIAAIIALLKKKYDFIVVDTASVLNDVILSAMDNSDLLLLVSVPDIMTAKNIRLSYDTLNNLGFSQEKIIHVLNRENSQAGLTTEEMESSITSKYHVILPNDGKMVLSSINRGVPFMLSHPDAPLSRELAALAGKIGSNNLEFGLKKDKEASGGLFGTFRKIFRSAEST
mgnify:CR=1 FL=1